MKLQTKLFVAFFLSASALDLRAQTSATPQTHSLTPGDQLVITVWRKPELSCECVVAGNGTVIHPLYREVAVTGVPLGVVEDRLRVFLTRYEQNPQFVIQPLVRIIVGGEVRSPNIYSVPPETTIAQAIALAGGASERGQLRDVRIIREQQEIRIDVSRPDSEAGLLQIRSGDQILMGRRRAPVREFISPVASSIAAVAGIVAIFLR
ncbi:MAG: polysaccharide biosynthesis/export family protein [Gemmatimonadaceae bacterium]